MELDAATVGALVVLALGLGVAALVVAGVALHGQRRVRAAYRTFSGGHREDVLTLLERHIDEVTGLRGDVAEQRAHARQLRGLIAQGVSRVGTVRYDAFDDMGGMLSFSAALLDEHGDGLVVTAFNGRTETRTYAKPITAGESRHNLSDEEKAAIAQALAGAGTEKRARDLPGRSAVRSARGRHSRAS